MSLGCDHVQLRGENRDAVGDGDHQVAARELGQTDDPRDAGVDDGDGAEPRHEHHRPGPVYHDHLVPRDVLHHHHPDGDGELQVDLPREADHDDGGEHQDHSHGDHHLPDTDAHSGSNITWVKFTKIR